MEVEEVDDDDVVELVEVTEDDNVETELVLEVVVGGADVVEELMVEDVNVDDVETGVLVVVFKVAA